MLEMINQCNWIRPIYVALTVGSENYMNLGDNFIQEGLANRITPFTTNAPGMKNFDTKKTYDNVMKKFKFGGVDQPGIYLDETVLRMCYTHRRLFANLAINLIQEDEHQKAKEVLAKCEKVLPEYNVPHDFQSGSLDFARAYALTNQQAKAQKLIDNLWKKSSQYLQWYCMLDGMRFASSQHDIMIQAYIMQQMLELEDLLDKKKSDTMGRQLDGFLKLFEAKGGRFEE